MTPKLWILIWAILFTLLPITLGPVHFPWYLLGTFMGAALFIGFAAMERSE